MIEDHWYESGFAEDLGKGIKYAGIGIAVCLSLFGAGSFIRGCGEGFYLNSQAEFISTQREKLSKLEKPSALEKFPQHNPFLNKKNL